MDYTLMPPDKPSLFTSMGMFIIDENRYPAEHNKEPERNIIGGALTYAVAGARMIGGPTRGPAISGIVDKGSDFPANVEKDLRRWGTGLIFRSTPDRLTTRGVNDYQANGIRNFFYETPKKRIEVFDILAYDSLLHLKSFHLICSIERCQQIIDLISANRGTDNAPRFIWEPVPDDCIPERYQSLVTLLSRIDVFSPNLIEAQNFLEVTDEELPTSEIETFVQKHFLKHLTKPAAGALIRCGARGCYVATGNGNISKMLPAFHSESAAIVDPTGCGNLFCGGFMVGYLLSKGDWEAGAICGNLVSGCIIERLGPPVLTGNDEGELWNSKLITQRWRDYRQRYGITTEMDWL